MGKRETDRDGPPRHLLRRHQGEIRRAEDGSPCKQLHSYDYGGPYAGFAGAINFYAEIDRMVNAKVWSYVKPPWETETPATDTAAEEPDYEAVEPRLTHSHGRAVPAIGQC